jgi:hypothetical protein
MYASLVADRRGATVRRHSWTQHPPSPSEPEVEAWVCEEIGALLDTVGGNPLLIAKSLGTNAAAVAAERRLPAVWLTPILTVPWIPEVWDSAVARRLSAHVLEIEGADHGLQVPGPLVDSIAVLGRVVTAMDEFLDAIDWPR